jgi:hypothetical protein
LINQETEEWFVFDMRSEHTDPRFLYWLSQHGIIAKVNTLGLRGLITNTKTALPAYVLDNLEDQKPPIMIPFSFSVTPNELFPNLGKHLDAHDLINGKPERFKYNPLDFNYGRPTRKVLIEYLLDTLAIASEQIERIEECDRKGLKSEFAKQIHSIFPQLRELRNAIRRN